jgi:hypothetical protein
MDLLAVDSFTCPVYLIFNVEHLLVSARISTAVPSNTTVPRDSVPYNTPFQYCFPFTLFRHWAGMFSRYRDSLQAGRSGDRIPVSARFSAPVQSGPAERDVPAKHHTTFRRSCPCKTPHYIPSLMSLQNTTLHSVARVPAKHHTTFRRSCPYKTPHERPSVVSLKI